MLHKFVVDEVGVLCMYFDEMFEVDKTVQVHLGECHSDPFFIAPDYLSLHTDPQESRRADQFDDKDARVTNG